jgi:hypothetical protein
MVFLLRFVRQMSLGAACSFQLPPQDSLDEIVVVDAPVTNAHLPSISSISFVGQVSMGL